MLRNVAPSGQPSDYDRRHLAVYAALLDADAVGAGWPDGARSILSSEVLADPAIAEACWQSHLARARWIVGEGLESALKAFDRA